MLANVLVQKEYGKFPFVLWGGGGGGLKAKFAEEWTYNTE